VPILIALIAAAAGVLNTVQSGANASLNNALGQPILAALIVAATNAVVYLLAVPFVGLAWPSGRFSNVPWWAWLGGALGAFYVTSTVVVPVRIGAAAFFGILVAAQLVTSVLADQFGWLSFQQRDITPLRAIGVALLIAGALLVRLF
jgi:transporter family-2 protein